MEPRRIDNKFENPLARGITLPNSKQNSAQAPQPVDARVKLRDARYGVKIKKASQPDDHVMVTGKDPTTGELKVERVNKPDNDLGNLEANQMRRSGFKISNQAPLQIKAANIYASQNVGRGGFGVPLDKIDSPEKDDGFELVDEGDIINLDARGKMQPLSSGLGNLKDQKSNKAYESPVKLKLAGSERAPVRISNLNLAQQQQNQQAAADAYMAQSSGQRSSRGTNKAKSQIRSFFNQSSRQQEAAVKEQSPVKQPAPRARSRPAILGWFSSSQAPEPQPAEPPQEDGLQNSIEKRFKNLGRGFMSFFGGVGASSPSPQRQEPEVADEADGNFRLANSHQLPNRKQIPQGQPKRPYDDGGPNRGHLQRSAGTRRRTQKHGHLECNEREFERLWRGLKGKLDELFDRKLAKKYEGMSSEELIKYHLRPYIDQMLDMLLEEDRQMEGQQGSIGECMEFTISNSVFLEMESLAQSNQPQGMFSVGLQFLLDLVTGIRTMPLIHNGNMHRSLLRICNCVFISLKNDVWDINDKKGTSTHVDSILEFMETMTQLSLNKDPEISKFFIEESTQKGRFRGTQTYLPVLVLLEFLKKEQMNQALNFKQRLRNVIIKQLQIKNPKVRRFLVLESDFSLNILNKLQMYLQMLPEDVQLIRDNYEQYPDDDTLIYKGGLSLEAQLKSNCSQAQVRSFECFVDFLKTIKQICKTAAVSQVQYESNGKKLVLLDQLCFTLFDYVLIGHFQPQILSERNLETPGLLRTQMQIIQKILETLQSEPKALLTLFYFFFGKTRQQMAAMVAEQVQDDKARQMFAQLDDDLEPEDDQLNTVRQILGENQDVSPTASADPTRILPPRSTKAAGGDNGLSLQLSKLNFRAKNQASSLSIHDPYAAKALTNTENSQQDDLNERQERIMQLFNDAGLDEDEQAFLNSSRSYKMRGAGGPSGDYSQMSARGLAQVMGAGGVNASFNLNDTMFGGADQDLLNQTMMTNFDNELDEMDNQFNNHKQMQIAHNFWRLTMLGEPKPALHCIDSNRRQTMFQFDAKKFRVEKLPTVNLLILDGFLAANLAEINETLLLAPLKPEDIGEPRFGDSQGNATGRSNMSMMYQTSQSASGKITGRVSESKYYQIVAAQSKKLKSETHFRHIRKLLNELQEKYSEFSSANQSIHQSQVQVGPRRSAFAQVRACTVRLDNYVSKIEFVKTFGRQFSEGAQACLELSHREIIEELEQEESSAVHQRLAFLNEFEGQIIKDSDVLLSESRVRASVLMRQARMRNSMLESPMLEHTDSFDYQKFKGQLRHETHADVEVGRPSRLLYQQDTELTGSSVSSNIMAPPAQVERCYTIDRSLYLDFDDDTEFWSADGDRKKGHGADDCDLASNNSENDTLAKQVEGASFNQINRKGRLQSLVQKYPAVREQQQQAKEAPKTQKSTSAESSVKEAKVFHYRRPSSQMSSMSKLDEHHSAFIKMLLKKTGDFFDNPLEENIVLVSMIERVLSYDVDYSGTAYSAMFRAQGVAGGNANLVTRERIYQVQKDVLLQLMNTLQKAETDLLGRLSLDEKLSSGNVNKSAKAMPIRIALVNRPEIYRYVLECLILQVPVENLTNRSYHRRIIHALAQLDHELLQPLIPIFDKVNNVLTDFHQVTSACRELFRNKRKQLQNSAYLLAWAFGNVRAGMLTQVNRVKQQNAALKDDNSGVARLKSTGLSAMLDAQQMAHQMQMAYEEAFKEDQELEASLGFYQNM